MVLWSERRDDAMAADHPVRLFDHLLRSAVLAETFREWEQEYVLLEGQPPYHPRDLAGRYLYGMLNRLRSSRQLEAASYNRLDVIWLLRRQHPDHSTIAGFVKGHGPRLRQLFRDVLEVGWRAQLVTLEHVAVDGTKMEADAGRESVRSEAKIRAWLGHVDAHLAALEAERTRTLIGVRRARPCRFWKRTGWCGAGASPFGNVTGSPGMVGPGAS